ncbi:MAG: histidine kinase [Tannerella sp.]|jgi:sensor histidine kinase YesM|nr:histidine kinase [Tannerella sp.]
MKIFNTFARLIRVTMVYDYRLFGKKSALKLSLAISVLHFFIVLIAYSFARTNDLKHSINFMDLVQVNTVVMFVANALLLYILFLFQFRAVKHIDDKRKRTPITILGSLMLVFILSPLFSQVQLLYNEQFSERMFMIINFVKDVVLVIITLLFTALMYAWDMNKGRIVENQKLLIQSLQDRYNALKNQVDPHFLFNSLNTLNGLIGYDDEKAHEYISQLSSMFRYTMQNKQILRVSEELNFAESYIYLIKMRYNESLQITYRIDEKYLDYYILPSALQVLIENAVKHNVISNKYPLSVAIETTENGTVCIKNSVRLKNSGVGGGGIGLSNLDERYRLVFDKKIKVTRDEHYFRVEVPLIKEIEKYNRNIYMSQNEL